MAKLGIAPYDAAGHAPTCDRVVPIRLPGYYRRKDATCTSCGRALSVPRDCAQCGGDGDVPSGEVDEDGDERPPVMCPRCGGSGTDPLQIIKA